MRSLVLMLILTQGAWAFDKTPSPSWTPTEVVDIVLSAMASNDTPEADAGIDSVWIREPSQSTSDWPFWHFKPSSNSRVCTPFNHTSRDIGEAVLSDTPLSTVVFSVWCCTLMWTWATSEASYDSWWRWVCASARLDEAVMYSSSSSWTRDTRAISSVLCWRRARLVWCSRDLIASSYIIVDALCRADTMRLSAYCSSALQCISW
jgi:hypothetical protein